MALSGPNGERLTGPDWSTFKHRVVGWAIYYVDGSCVTCEQKLWEDAPENGVAAVIVYHDTPGDKPRKTVVSGCDEYTMEDETATKLGEQVGEVDASAEWDGIQKSYQRDCELIFPRYDG